MRVTSIVPNLTPEVNGVGDYGLRLAHQLHQECSINTSFIIGNPYWRHGNSVDGFETNWVDRRSAETLQKSLLLFDFQSAGVLVHYVGHGYAKGGIPFWLIQGLAHWKLQNPNSRIVTMFHEIYTVDPVWNPRFWLSPLQKKLIARLVCMSDKCVTNVPSFSKILSSFSHEKHQNISVMPVFSNVGEPRSILPLELRKRRLVIFGQSHSKTSVYREAIPIIQKICQVLKIHEILDIGPSCGIDRPNNIGHLSVVEAGKLPASEISSILENSLAGFLNYDPSCLTKSGVFAAYCAHGMIPINYEEELMTEYFSPSKHYLASNFFKGNSFLRDVEWQKIANNAYSWYNSHNSRIQAAFFASQLNSEDTFSN